MGRGIQGARAGAPPYLAPVRFLSRLQFTQNKTPEYMAAARKTIDYRLAHGGGHTGWSRAWIINFWARFHDADKAYENVQRCSADPR